MGKKLCPILSSAVRLIYMQTLRPFQGILPIGISAELSLREALITIEYKLELRSPILGVPNTSAAWHKGQVNREDQLWATTCFEAFLNPVGTSKYYEFNFSLKPAWNVYEFSGYRQPQPPKTSQDFDLINLDWNNGQSLLSVKIVNNTDHRDFNVSLTAVLEEPNQHKHYGAITHSENKPDFHAAESFTLHRSNREIIGAPIRGIKK